MNALKRLDLDERLCALSQRLSEWAEARLKVTGIWIAILFITLMLGLVAVSCVFWGQPLRELYKMTVAMALFLTAGERFKAAGDRGGENPLRGLWYWKLLRYGMLAFLAIDAAQLLWRSHSGGSLLKPALDTMNYAFLGVTFYLIASSPSGKVADRREEKGEDRVPHGSLVPKASKVRS